MKARAPACAAASAAMPAAFHVDLPEFVPGLGQRHQGGVVVDDFHAAHGLEHPLAVANVARDELDLPGPGRVFPDVQDLDPLAALKQPAGDEVAQET